MGVPRSGRRDRWGAVVPCPCLAVFSDDRDDECICDDSVHAECDHYCVDHDLHHCPYNHPSDDGYGGPYNNHFTASDHYLQTLEEQAAFNEQYDDAPDYDFNPVIICGNAVAAGLHGSEARDKLNCLLPQVADSQRRARIRRERGHERSAVRKQVEGPQWSDGR